MNLMRIYFWQTCEVRHAKNQLECHLEFTAETTKRIYQNF